MRHPQYPWILYRGHTIECSVCNRGCRNVQGAAAAFVAAHANHRSTSPSHMGAGDAFAAIAKPVARAFGRKPCAPCERRQRAMNRAVPAIPFLRRR